MEVIELLGWIAKNYGTDGKCKKVSFSETEGPNSRGMPLGKWKDKVKEYMGERDTDGGGGPEQAKRACLDRETWMLFRQDYG